MWSRVLSGVYGREFSQARRTCYALILTMFALSVTLPIHYSCGGASRCIGCGFRAALADLLRLDLASALRENGLVPFAVLFFALMAADLVAMRRLDK